MDFLDSPWVGGFCIVFGVATLVLRFVKPGVFAKLEAMKERFGERGGYAMHVIGYSVLPIVYGVLLLLKHRSS